MEQPILDLTFGPMRAPEVTYDPVTKEVWLSWRSPRASIDVKLMGRSELRTLIRSALEAAGDSEREAHVLTRPG